MPDHESKSLSRHRLTEDPTLPVGVSERFDTRLPYRAFVHLVLHAGQRSLGRCEC